MQEVSTIKDSSQIGDGTKYVPCRYAEMAVASKPNILPKDDHRHSLGVHWQEHGECAQGRPHDKQGPRRDHQGQVHLQEADHLYHTPSPHWH